MTDTRSEPDAFRRARFHEGWKHACAGRTYVEDTLSRLTWQNLGWRIGSAVGTTSPTLMDEMYDWCVRQQAESHTTVADE